MARWFNITIDQGAYFETAFAVTTSGGSNSDLSDYTPTAAFKEYYTYGTKVEFDTRLDPTSNNRVIVSMSANATADLNPGRYVYDVKIDNGVGSVIRVAEGYVTVNPSVS